MDLLVLILEENLLNTSLSCAKIKLINVKLIIRLGKKQIFDMLAQEKLNQN